MSDGDESGGADDLSDDVSDGDAGRPDPRGEIVYDCSPWAGETRRILRSILADRGMPHAWEGTVLVVPAQFEDEVDGIVDEVAATARRPLGRFSERVAYDVSPWSVESQNRLVDLLVQGSVPHEWDDDGDLVVREQDAEVTEDFIAELGEPDGGEEIDGLELHERLDSLFGVADRLARNPTDRGAAADAPVAAGGIAGVTLPFGVEPMVWSRVQDATAAVVLALSGVASGIAEDDDATGDDAGGEAVPVGEAAAQLRDLLRLLV